MKRVFVSLLLVGLLGFSALKAQAVEIEGKTSGDVFKTYLISDDRKMPVDLDGEVVDTEYTNSGIATGEVQGSATAAVFPTVTAKMVMFKAVKGNAGNVYIGIAGVTVVDGTTDTTSGFELGAGETTGWIPASNLNLFYRICDNAGDDVVYMVLQ